MSTDQFKGVPSFSIEAAHAADREKSITYLPRPLSGAPDYDALRTRALQATRQARRDIEDEQD